MEMQKSNLQMSELLQNWLVDLQGSLRPSKGNMPEPRLCSFWRKKHLKENAMPEDITYAALRDTYIRNLIGGRHGFHPDQPPVWLPGLERTVEKVQGDLSERIVENRRMLR